MKVLIDDLKKSESDNNEIVVLVDFSASTQVAINHAVLIAREIKAKIRLLHVLPPQSVIASGHQIATIRAIGELTTEAYRKMQLLCDLINETGIESSPFCTLGPVHDEIRDFLNKAGATLVIATKEKKIFGLTGKTMKYLISDYSSPVLTINADANLKYSSRVSFLGKTRNLKTSDIDLLNAIANDFDPVEAQSDLDVHQISAIKSTLARKGIGLLCVSREEYIAQRKPFFKWKNHSPEKILEQIDIPLLFIGQDTRGIGHLKAHS